MSKYIIMSHRLKTQREEKVIGYILTFGVSVLCALTVYVAIVSMTIIL